jgi:DNA-binding LacI/PurR family transcriptional regulator
MDVVRERGRRIPDDVAVMGFDNWQILAADARPPLTSVDMNLEEVGRAAARAVFAALEGRPEERSRSAAVPGGNSRFDRTAELRGRRPRADALGMVPVDPLAD